MNKRLLLTIIIVLVVLVGIVVWKSTASSAAIQQTKSTIASTDSSQHSTNETMQNKTQDELLQESLSKKLHLLQQQPGNITQFLADFQASCKVQDCNAALVKALANYPDQKFAHLVENLLLIKNVREKINELGITYIYFQFISVTGRNLLITGKELQKKVFN